MFNKDALQKFYQYCYVLTCDEHNAFDLLQTALEKYLRQNINPAHPTAYMKRIIHNQFIDEYRRNNKIQMDSLEDVDLPIDFDIRTLESIAISSEMVEQIFSMLEPEDREILYFWAVEGFSTSQISELLQTPKGTILSRIYRMRHKLINEFSDVYGGEAVEVIT
jgi:RNA polymerase sigma-70 factor (ECF subfamily)